MLITGLHGPVSAFCLGQVLPKHASMGSVPCAKQHASGSGEVLRCIKGFLCIVMLTSLQGIARMLSGSNPMLLASLNLCSYDPHVAHCGSTLLWLCTDRLLLRCTAASFQLLADLLQV
ncbi:hypothetical protein ABBQ38_013367 [Trebouxia sp. C0009 RCD-2024]